MLFRKLTLAASPSRATASEGAPIDRLYIGSELCPGRLPTLPELRKAGGAGVPLTLVTPPVAGAAFRHVSSLLEHLEHEGREVEVLVNDFGVLEMAAARANATPVLGRLLSRSFVELTGDKLSLASRDSIGYLKREYRVGRFEVTNYRTRITFSEVAECAGVPLSLHYPYQPLTLSRSCAFRFADALPDARFDSVLCKRPCRTQSFRLNYPGQVKDDLYLRGNTVFIRYPELPYTAEELTRLGIDRVVLGEGPEGNGQDDITEVLRLLSQAGPSR